MTPPLWQKWSHHRGYLGHEDLFCIVLCVFLLPWWVRGKASACSVGDQVWSLGQEDPLEKEMATHSSPLAWKIPWATIHGVAQSVGHDWATSLSLSYLSYLLMKVKEESEKAGLKLNVQKRKVMASRPITSWQIDWKQWKQWQTLFSWASKSLQMVTAAMKLKDAWSLEEKLRRT